MEDIKFPNYFQILFAKIEAFFGTLTEIEVSIIAVILTFILILLVCFLILIVECVVRCRTLGDASNKLSAETYFKRSIKISEKMSKINTPEFKHFELQLRGDSGTSSLSASRESGMDSCFTDRRQGAEGGHLAAVSGGPGAEV